MLFIPFNLSIPRLFTLVSMRTGGESYFYAKRSKYLDDLKVSFFLNRHLYTICKDPILTSVAQVIIPDAVLFGIQYTGNFPAHPLLLLPGKFTFKYAIEDPCCIIFHDLCNFVEPFWITDIVANDHVGGTLFACS